MADAKTKKQVGKSADEFLKAYDKNTIVPKRIRDALESLGASWLPEVEFMRLAQLSTTDLAMFREQFEDYFLIVGSHNPKRIWFGDKKLAADMRAKVS
jgi:hypothetical protein